MPTEEEIAKAAAAKAAEEEDAKPVTMADIKALFAKDLPTLVNSVVATHNKRLEAKFAKEITALKAPKPAEGEEGADVEQPTGEQPKLAKLGAAPKDPPKPETPAAAQPDPELVKLRRQLELMQTKQRESEQKAAQAERKRLESEGFASLKSALSGKVAAGSEDTVLATLKGRNAVVIGDDGAVRLKLGVKDEPEDGHDLSEGVAQYLKSPEAKFFLPVPNAGLAVKKNNGQTLPAHRPNGAQPVNAEEAFQQKTGKAITDVL